MAFNLAGLNSKVANVDGTEVLVPDTFTPEMQEHIEVSTSTVDGPVSSLPKIDYSPSSPIQSPFGAKMFNALFPDGAPGVIDEITDAIDTGDIVNGATDLLFGLSISRIAVMVVGVILIIAGIFSFKGTREVVGEVADKAKLAALAA